MDIHNLNPKVFQMWSEQKELGIPDGLLSIMTDVGGNNIAIAIRPDRLGEIFFLDREVSGGEGRVSLERAESDD